MINNKKSLTDTRTTAIAEGSKVFLETQGLWKFIKKFAEPIKNIKVVDTTANSNLDFTSPTTKSNLGYIVKNSKLISVLIKELKKKNERYNNIRNHLVKNNKTNKKITRQMLSSSLIWFLTK